MAADGAAHEPTNYGARTAPLYDDVYEQLLDTAAALELLTPLAGGGRVLDIGVGTGRLALPLLERGCVVVGVEVSPDMVSVLRSKPRGDEIDVVVGDFADVEPDGLFRLALMTFNVIFAPPDQDTQVLWMRRAARHLEPAGALVVEADLPPLDELRAGRLVRPICLGGDRLLLEVAEVEPAQQRMRTTKVLATSQGIQMWPANHRYVWPAELDLMAQLAGLRLEQRWADWRQTPFGDASRGHVSVYRRPAEQAPAR